MTIMGDARRIVLLTGAAGRIGTAFRRQTGERYRFRLADRQTDGLGDTPGTGHQILALDIVDAEAVRAACVGVDTVVHLAADPSPEADWETSLLPNNVTGTLNVFRAALATGCRRVVFASSVHAVAAYPSDDVLADDAPPRPANLYGASKAFGESLASVFATQGLSAIAVRIGAYDAPWLHAGRDPVAVRAYVSAHDLNHLLVRCIEAEGIGYALAAGVSANRPNRFDLLQTSALLGYVPRDDGFRVLKVEPPR